MPDNLYEAMFVVDAAKGGSGFPETIRYIAGLLSRNGATVQRIEKWDERKLAYPIGRTQRGVYILVYFTSDGSAIAEIRRATDLSEELLRVLVLKADEPSPVKGQLFTPEGEQTEPEAPAAEPQQEETGPPPAEGEPQQEETEPPPAEGEPQPEEGGEAEQPDEAGQEI